VRFPRRFEDRSRFQPIASLRAGGTAAILGEILTCGVAPTRRQGFALFTALVQDESGQVKAVWPNQKFLKDVLQPKMKVVLFGRTEYWGSRGLQLTAPEFEVLQDDERTAAHRAHRAVYERTGSVTPNMHRTRVHRALRALDALPDIVPAAMSARHAGPIGARRSGRPIFPIRARRSKR
jgi:RecG-like helicase